MSNDPASTPTPAEVARHIDHTLLRPEAVASDVVALCAEAGRLGVAAVCVSPTMVPVAAEAVPDAVAVAAVCGFPSGAHDPAVKAHEAGLSVAQGADEVDVVVDLGAVKAHAWGAVERGLAEVRAAIPGAVLKVILETGLLTDEEVVAAARAAEAAGADFVKTSTGFSPAGGATEHAVAILHATVGGRLGVKASGGIRTFDDAVRMLRAGATRLGVSGTAALLASAPDAAAR